MANTTGKGGFQKGQSGNPGGRASKTVEHYEVEQLAREKSPRAIERLEHWMNSNKDPAVSVKACVAILDRAFGKPAQELRHKKHGNSALEDFRDSQLAELVARGIARNGGRGAGGVDRPAPSRGSSKSGRLDS